MFLAVDSSRLLDEVLVHRPIARRSHRASQTRASRNERGGSRAPRERHALTDRLEIYIYI